MFCRLGDEFGAPKGDGQAALLGLARRTRRFILFSI